MLGMNQNVQAIYSKGILKPLGPLHLKDEELVDLTVSSVSEDASDIRSDEDFSYQPMPPQRMSHVLMQYIHHGKGSPLPYDDSALDLSDEG